MLNSDRNSQGVSFRKIEGDTRRKLKTHFQGLQDLIVGF